MEFTPLLRPFRGKHLFRDPNVVFSCWFLAEELLEAWRSFARL